MKHFIITLQYIKPIESIDEHLVEHRSFLDSGYEKGILLASGPQNPRSGGVLIGRAETLESMRAFCNEDPFYVHGCAEYGFMEFLPVKYRKEFRDWFVETPNPN
jgi:uncharacterized protein YciI